LHHALREAAVSLPEENISSLMNAYNSLSIFPDVAPLFKALSSIESLHAVVFSNGTRDMIRMYTPFVSFPPFNLAMGRELTGEMIDTSLTQSPDLSPHANLFRDIVVVDDLPAGKKKFKPCPEVYHHLCSQVGKTGKEGDVWLVSGNPFDILGANTCGLRSCWIDRSGNGWMDALGEGWDGKSGRPTVIARSVGEVVQKVSLFMESA
jgi:2-haloacid dehalogenase